MVSMRRHSRLRGRILGRQSRCDRQRVNLRLDDTQCQELFHYRDTVDQGATPLTPQLIKAAAEAILQRM